MGPPLATLSLLDHDTRATAPRPDANAGLRARLTKLVNQRDDALGRGDDATVARCEDAILRCELALGNALALHAELRARYA